jgi:Ni,Fe-hydrogenase III component G
MGPIVFELPEAKVGEWKAFERELTERWESELADMDERYQLTQHRAWLATAADGSHYAVLDYRGPGAENFLSRLAESTHPFDRWFREELSDAYGIDFTNLPDLKRFEKVLDYERPPSP